VYEYVNSQLVEYSTPGVTAAADPFTTLSFYATIFEENCVSSYRMSFKTNYKVIFKNCITILYIKSFFQVPVGYDSSL